MELKRQNALLEVDASRAIERGQTIQRLESANSKLKNQVQKLQQINEEKGRSLAQVRAELRGKAEATKEQEDLRARLELQEHLLDFGTSAIREKREEAEKYATKNFDLQQALAERDNRMNAMEDLISQMENATGDQMLGLALEAQAQSTLRLVQGLKSDVAERDVAIENLQTAIANRDAKAQKQKEPAEILASTEETLPGANQPSTDAQEILEEQGQLIERLVAENRSLRGGSTANGPNG